jgi:hypothetical protein
VPHERTARAPAIAALLTSVAARLETRYTHTTKSYLAYSTSQFINAPTAPLTNIASATFTFIAFSVYIKTYLKPA